MIRPFEADTFSSTVRYIPAPVEKQGVQINSVIKGLWRSSLQEPQTDILLVLQICNDWECMFHRPVHS